MVSKEQQDRIKVGVRIRPFLQSEIGKENVVFLGQDNQSIRVSDGNHFIESKFDYVFNEQSQQEEVFGFVSNQVQQVVKGYNCTILAYGQTGSGKTFTMFGANWELNRKQQQIHPKNHGIIPRSVSCVFDEITLIKSQKGNFTVFCSFIQIYNEKIFDLLQDEERLQPLAIREDKISGIFVEGLSEYVVQTSRDCLALIKRGDRNRAVRQTRFNANSSRSHTIFQLLIETEKVNKKGNLKRAKINLCDLAGSEKYDKEGEMKGGHLAEMNKINLSLTNLGKVISSLSKGAKSTHIPFRDSKLTRLIQDSLGGNCKTILITMISPVGDFVDESINTLKFADRAKQVMIRVKKNEIDATNNALVKKLQREIEYLKELLNIKRKGNQKDLKEENERLRDIAQITPVDVENLKKENKNLRLELQRIQLASPTTRSTISTQDPSVYNFSDNNLGSSQSNSGMIIAQHNYHSPNSIQQDGVFKQQKTCSYENIQSLAASKNVSQRDLVQMEESKNQNQENLRQFLVFEGRCQKCQTKPPCIHYTSAESLIVEQQKQQIQQQMIANQSEQISSSILEQKMSYQLNRSSPENQTPNSRSGFSVNSNVFRVSSISGRSNLSGAGRLIAKSQVITTSDQVQVRIRTRNNLYQSAVGNVSKSNKEAEREVNRVKEIRRAEERLKTLEQIEHYKHQKLERELKALEEQKRQQELDRIEQKKKLIEKRKHLEETKKKVAMFEQNKVQKLPVLGEREKLAMERKKRLDLDHKDRFEQQVSANLEIQSNGIQIEEE